MLSGGDVTLSSRAGVHPGAHYIAAIVKRHTAIAVESGNLMLDWSSPRSPGRGHQPCALCQTPGRGAKPLPSATVHSGGGVTISKGRKGRRTSGDGRCEGTWSTGQDRPLLQAAFEQRVLPEIRVPDAACQQHCLDKPRALVGGEASALLTCGDHRVLCWVFISIRGLHSLDAIALPRE